MASKKKNTKKPVKSKKSAGRKAASASKRAGKRAATKKSVKKKVAPNRSVAKKKALKKTIIGKTANLPNVRSRSERQGRGSSVFSREASGSSSGGQSGDLQGLSNVETADSESVDELLEEGNAFEAEVVSGVEDAGERGVREVRTHEVPEDDVPGEYLDED
jgi:hypothetical protein